ncbi:MAG TPA: 4-hydroxythreonine-4-phosphate dehydrogenase PdxA [Desulfobacteraceae bacterium]|nr:4-hydroxythreonine-4-phosphate dehydrogenase PdxA [Desulfobacteraceae bacterium]
METYRPVIGITMGDPVGIGPEIIISALSNPLIYELCRPLVIGDLSILRKAQKSVGKNLKIKDVNNIRTGIYKNGNIDVLALSSLDPDQTVWGKPTVLTGSAMVNYITTAIDLAADGSISAIVTCPINKKAMHMAGFNYNGHTELLAERTRTDNFVMMLAGSRLRVALVTIHMPLKDVPAVLSKERIFNTIKITWKALNERFDFENPRVAVAGLNPHAGEEGMFGSEEKNIIMPAIDLARKEGFDVSGPFPADTIFYHAANGSHDAVVCMYHDQGLIPLKLLHFTDGVNTTLGLPIVRTSVDHGTAYDIAGGGNADPGSLIAAINMAVHQALSIKNKKYV